MPRCSHTWSIGLRSGFLTTNFRDFIPDSMIFCATLWYLACMVRGSIVMIEWLHSQVLDIILNGIYSNYIAYYIQYFRFTNFPSCVSGYVDIFSWLKRMNNHMHTLRYIFDMYWYTYLSWFVYAKHIYKLLCSSSYIILYYINM